MIALTQSGIFKAEAKVSNNDCYPIEYDEITDYIGRSMVVRDLGFPLVAKRCTAIRWEGGVATRIGGKTNRSGKENW